MVRAPSQFPLPAGFTPTSHTVEFVRVDRFSDVVVTALRDAAVDLAGLVCSRKRGELRFRMPAGADLTPLWTLLETSFGARTKKTSSRRVTLRASGVPPALLDKLAMLVARVDADLKLVGHRIWGSTFDGYLTVGLTMEGKEFSPGSPEEWRFSGLGLHPVVLKRLEPRRPAATLTTSVVHSARPPAPRRPLTSVEQVSWADRVRRSEAARGDGQPAAAPSTSSARPTPSPPVPASASVAISEDAEIPLRRRPRAAFPAVAQPPPPPQRAPQHRPPQQRQDLALAKPSVPPRRKGGSQASAHPTAQASRSSSPVSPPSHPVASSAGSASAPVTAGVTVARFETLVSQVAQLTDALAAQQQAYATLQEQLKASLAECADLRLRLRPSKSKRSRSASASTPSTPADRSGSEPPMSSGEEEPALKSRHSSVRRTQPMPSLF